jgi:SAM-dependent methyltransferase
VIGLAFAYDDAAPGFDRHRALPDGVAVALRQAVLAAAAEPRPRLLDLGAGTGRIGWPFVAAGDDYVGVDLSLGMLREFARRDGPPPRLVQADGERLPFADASFDAVMLMQVLGAARDWRTLVGEALRVLRRPGAVVLGHTAMPSDGLDARMKKRLAALLRVRGAPSYHHDPRAAVVAWLGAAAQESRRVVAAEWDACRTPAGFLERQPGGARFARLPPQVKDEALAQLRSWAIASFGSLKVAFRERHAFALDVFNFRPDAGR